MYDYMDGLLMIFRKFMVKQFENYKHSDESLSKTKKLYKLLYETVCKLFLKIVKHYYKKAGGKRKKYDEDWLFDFLLEFDPITGYQFANEWERKMYRCYEEVESQKKAKKNPNLKKQVELLNSQVTQKSIETADYGTVEGYRENGVKKVLWVATLDHKTCDECRERNGKIFRIDEIPQKHYNCRCILKAVREDSNRKR